ncbi:MAG: ATP-binding protein [Treponema sp.]|jgi:tetratricopeptide (TPR) repeat protein|nr:ATP-binding protein [Treponema sp.]
MQLLFFMRYKSQLSRTRPALVSRLEESIVRACGASGGNVKRERRLLSVSFDEQKIAARLDILTALEGILDILKKDGPGLYGYSLVLGPMTEEDGYEGQGRLLASEGGGIWFGKEAQKDMSPYVYFEKERPAPFPAYVRFKGIKTFDAASGKAFPFRETILRALRQSGGRNVLVQGPPFSGKRDGVLRFASGLFPGISEAERENVSPVLVFRFGTGGSGLCPFLDAWSPSLRSFLGEAVSLKECEELDGLAALLFRERLRDEIPAYMRVKGRRFLDLLLALYVGGMKHKGLTPVLVLENLHQAETAAAEIFMEACRAFSGGEAFPVYGTAAFTGDAGQEEALKPWERMFPRIVRLNAGSAAPLPFPDLSPDLLEAAYALELFCRCFPGFLLERLFEEGGKSPAAIARAYSLLRHFDVIDIAADPRPRIPDFAAQAESRLGQRAGAVRALVRERLLDWTGNKIRPCFRLLEILAGLGDEGASGADPSLRESRDALVLKSISADLTSGTDGGLRRALARGKRFEKIAGAERTETLAYIAETERALLYGTGADIRNAFAAPSPEPYGPYKARILVNLTAYHLGMRDAASALETVKEAILLSQGKPWMGLAGAYRLFSLVNLARQRMVETLDYAAFAVENAEKTGSIDEMGIALYYTAAAQFLYGNISRAERLAADTIKQAEKTGRPEWADRARFLLGKFHFETGRYQDALDMFEDLLKGNPSPEKEQLLAAWVYRSKIYLQSPLIRKPGGGCPDADLFEIEASYLAGDYKKTAELCSRFSAPAEQFVFTEQPDWRSGFAQCELLMLLPSEFWGRTVSVYHSLALCRLSRTGAGEAVRTMQRMLRDEGLSDMDPNGAFYLYAFYRILEDSGAPQVDMNTAVSMAFKRLQRRASRIDDMEVQGGFLSLPCWNKALSRAARVYKLI